MPALTVMQSRNDQKKVMFLCLAFSRGNGSRLVGLRGLSLLFACNACKPPFISSLLAPLHAFNQREIKETTGDESGNGSVPTHLV